MFGKDSILGSGPYTIRSNSLNLLSILLKSILKFVYLIIFSNLSASNDDIIGIIAYVILVYKNHIKFFVLCYLVSAYEEELILQQHQ